MTVPFLVLRGVDMRQAVVASSSVAISMALIGAVGLGLSDPKVPQPGSLSTGLLFCGHQSGQYPV